MKWFAVILSIYFLALNAVPCSDASNDDYGVQFHLIVDLDGDHGEDCGLCSPFCHCHCCHAHAIDMLLFFTELERPQINGEISSWEKHILQDVSFRFFQPPKKIG